MSDVITFLLLIMLLFSAYRYTTDTKECKAFLESGSQVIWNNMIESGVDINSIIQAVKSEVKLTPGLLTNGLKTNFTACTGTNFTEDGETCQ